MANTRDIRRRIRSVKNTSQITRAMQLVAAAKMKKAQDQALAGRAFADRLNKTINNLKARPEGLNHPFLGNEEVAAPVDAETGEAKPKAEKELVIVINTDKGLCGGLNTNLLKAVIAGSSEDSDFVTVGKKLRATLARMDRNLVADFPVADPVDFATCKQVAKFASEKFLEGEYTTVRVAFTNFVNTLRQDPVVETLLPVCPIELGAQKEYEGVGKDEEKDEGPPSCPSYLFEPSPREVLDVALPMFVNYQVYQMILESRASEHSSRMVAMKSATDNAKELVKDLTLQYNKVRQAAITNELLEITTAMKALE